MSEEAAHRRRPPLDHVALRAVLADLLAEADVAQQPDVRRHQDHDEGEREQQALDELEGHARDPATASESGPPSASTSPSTTCSSSIPRDALTRTTSPGVKHVGQRPRPLSPRPATVTIALSAPGPRRGRHRRSRPPAHRARRRRRRAGRACGRPPRRPRDDPHRGRRRARASRPGRRAWRPGRPASSSRAARTEPGRRVVRVVDDRRRRPRGSRPSDAGRVDGAASPGTISSSAMPGREPGGGRRERVVDGEPAERRDLGPSRSPAGVTSRKRHALEPERAHVVARTSASGGEAVGRHAGAGASGHPRARARRRR